MTLSKIKPDIRMFTAISMAFPDFLILWLLPPRTAMENGLIPSETLNLKQYLINSTRQQPHLLLKLSMWTLSMFVYKPMWPTSPKPPQTRMSLLPFTSNSSAIRLRWVFRTVSNFNMLQKAGCSVPSSSPKPMTGRVLARKRLA